MELDYGQPTAQVGGMLTYPDYTYADNPKNVVAEQINTLGGSSSTITIGGGSVTVLTGSSSYGGNNLNWPGVL